MADQLSKNDVGSVISVTVKENGVVFNASAATVKTLRLKKPNETVITKTAVFETDGSNGVLIYTTVAGDLNENGMWTGQLYLEFPTGKWSTDVFTFVVGNILT